MPHVAVLFEFPTLNGGEHSMLAVLQQLRRQAGFRFSAVAPATGPLSDAFAELQIAVHPFQVRGADGRKQPVERLRQQLQIIIRKLQPDLLHANSLAMSRLVGQCAPFPCRCTGHLRDIINLNRKPLADLNRNDRLVAVSQATRSHHVDRGLDGSRCEVIYNGIDSARFQAGATGPLSAGNQYPAGRMLLNVGQICLRKGQLDLARAVVRLLPKYPDLQLVLAGERHSGKAESVDYESSIRNEFASRGLSAHLHTIGYCDQVAGLMKSATLLTHAARQEPFGRVLLEAAACELPIVATDVGGTPEMLRDGREAWLVPAGHVDRLADAIDTALLDLPRRLTLAAAAHRRVREHFSLQTAAERLAEFWRRSVA